MIHEVMVLDHSGPAFACVLYGASLKLFAIAALVVGLCLPTTGNPWYDWLAFLGALMALAMVIGLVESSMARLRMPRVPQLLVAATLACAFGFLLMLM
jgi:formate hydrogenlyase subunit 4